MVLWERQAIERGLESGLTQKAIAHLLGRSPSTVCREIARTRRDVKAVSHRRPGAYRAQQAHDYARIRGLRPQPGRCRGLLGAVVAGYLCLDWSPRQISRMLVDLFPDNDQMRISHETIYQSLYVQTRGSLRRDLAAHLRTGRTSRKPHSTVQRRGKLVGMVPIAERDPAADDRKVPGHWEGDLLLGGVGKGAVITLVERTTRFVLLAPLPTTHTGLDLRLRLTEIITRLPEQLRKSLAWDQGSEMSQHARFSLDTGLAVYFCDPHSPWQRGSNENTNGLLRQYWPKGCDMRHLTQDDCDLVANRLNSRPRETLHWKTPAQALDQILIATAA